MHNILAIESSTSACSVALNKCEEVLQKIQVGENVHSHLILDFVNQLLGESDLALGDLDRIAVSVGPGAFTGLRIGIGIAQGIAAAQQIPMIAVGSLEALAWNSQGKCILAALDARMDEIYLASFKRQSASLQCEVDARLYSPKAVEDLLLGAEPAHLVGNAWNQYVDQIDPKALARHHWHRHVLYPQAESVLEIARRADRIAVPAKEITPVYVRDRVAKKPATSN